MQGKLVQRMQKQQKSDDKNRGGAEFDRSLPLVSASWILDKGTGWRAAFFERGTNFAFFCHRLSLLAIILTSGLPHRCLNGRDIHIEMPNKQYDDGKKCFVATKKNGKEKMHPKHRQQSWVSLRYGYFRYIRPIYWLWVHLLRGATVGKAVMEGDDSSWLIDWYPAP